MTISLQQNGRSERNIDYEIERQKAIEQKLRCKIVRIDPEFDIFRAINEIFGHIKQSTEKTLISKISTRLLRLELKSDNETKSKAIKLIIKIIFPDYKQ